MNTLVSPRRHTFLLLVTDPKEFPAMRDRLRLPVGTQLIELCIPSGEDWRVEKLMGMEVDGLMMSATFDQRSAPALTAYSRVR